MVFMMSVVTFPLYGAYTLEVYRGKEVASHFMLVSALRCKHYKEFPFLYVADAAADAEAMKSYAESAESLLVVAQKEGVPVAIAMGLPFAETPLTALCDDAFERPFDQYFYIADVIVEQNIREQELVKRWENGCLPKLLCSKNIRNIVL